MGTTRRRFLETAGAAAAALAVGDMPAALGAPKRPGGFALGFSSLKDETRIPDLAVEGRMPRWLTGTLLRNGPALFEIGPDRFNHWFDGLSMLHAFSFHRGRVGYANRFLRSSQYRAWKRDGRIRYSEFGTDPCRQIYSGVSTMPILGAVPNANVSIDRLGRQFRALTELPVPVRFDPDTLRTLGVEAQQPLGRLGTAHPHHDPRTGEHFAYEIDLVPPSGLRILSLRAGRRRELAWVPDPSPGYLHSFALTPRYIAVFTQPFNFDLAGFLKPDRGPIVTNYKWDASKPARVLLIDRDRGGVVATAELEPSFVFHNVNAFESKGRIVIDLCAHRDSSIVDALYLKRLRRGHHVPQARLRRLELDPGRGRATQRDLIEANLELPRIDYERRNGRPYRYAYGVGLRRRSSGFIDQLVKADVKRGESKIWRENEVFPGEPVFVRRPGTTREDDGVLLSVVLDAGRRSSALVVLDARSMEEMARASVPHHIPFGFHGVHAA